MLASQASITEPSGEAAEFGAVSFATVADDAAANGCGAPSRLVVTRIAGSSPPVRMSCKDSSGCNATGSAKTQTAVMSSGAFTSGSLQPVVTPCSSNPFS